MYFETANARLVGVGSSSSILTFLTHPLDILSEFSTYFKHHFSINLVSNKLNSNLIRVCVVVVYFW
jgi:hypothetical protein